ncbi:helix-turn-helix transcriptional regulator [Amycolatopsis japonica]|uniref:helix-turn-helix transcriptional regulator n=1 Tax=Amycolatopsis japonica TaxID=208439 RepID=UPI00366F52E2
MVAVRSAEEVADVLRAAYRTGWGVGVVLIPPPSLPAPVAAKRGRRLRFIEARRAAGYTQESLAEALEVDSKTVASWEQGRATPHLFRHGRIARTLRMTAAEFRVALATKVGSPAK